MDEESIRARIAQIEQAAEAGDYEVAHSREDELYLELLKLVAANPGRDYSGFAALALSVSEMDFARYCA